MFQNVSLTCSFFFSYPLRSYLNLLFFLFFFQAFFSFVFLNFSPNTHPKMLLMWLSIILFN